ncbi:hypothetical protein F5Y06DRAFT_105021 [Hypoxylon sp. FL0890]|nr:hypothetical protein F5Y06DRAFT_105021 [Hypoxylon sp. FL0890]
MIFFIITASLLWWFTLANFVLQDYRLLLKTTRVATNVYLVIFGLVVAEVIREGLFVLGLEELHAPFRLLWVSWFMLVVIGTIYWVWLIPAALIAIVVLSMPDVRMLLNYGLLQLGWLEFAYNPIWFVVSRAFWPFKVLQLLFGPTEYEFLQPIRNSTFGRFVGVTLETLDRIPQHLPLIAPISQRLKEIQRSR